MAVVTRARFNFLSVLVAMAAVYTVMIDLCEDMPRCSVLASPETFTQDPCAGTTKYLEAHYKCRPTVIQSLSSLLQHFLLGQVRAHVPFLGLIQENQT
ncbi:hypothetical protein RRG08_033903 [Elysia crispata]|uniref:SUEL-type lectin domain-containing protein n=1 Tax=Elysia crispata TaxID=231223 RepID=A0AAE1EBP5_9GAST|nr:hypothetical protein RRG08_033903 [Elysia crispata]